MSFHWGSAVRFGVALAATLAVATSTLPTAKAQARCGPRGYAYAGMQSSTKGHGIAADLAALATPDVESGHVAGWVGLGARGEGPGGTDEWIQVGLNRLPDRGNTLYYEVMRPGSDIRYSEVQTDVPVGRHFRVAVLEISSMPGAWRVWVNGRPVTAPIRLKGGTRLTPMAMGESWDGGRSTCNRYSYRFRHVSIAAAPGGSWQPAREPTLLQDPGYRVVARATSTFDAAAVGLLPAGQGAQRPGLRALTAASRKSAAGPPILPGRP